MEIINDDKWDAEVWGTAHSDITDEMDTARWNLIFYWGKNVRPCLPTVPWISSITISNLTPQQDSLVSNRTRDGLIANKGRRLTMKQDKWVADHTRDSFIKDRSSRASKENEESKPSMLMDDKGIPHAFCISTTGDPIVQSS